MYPHSHTPDNEPDHSTSVDDHTASIIPLPRRAPDDNLPETGTDQPFWRYDQKRTRGDDHRFTGRVTRVGGAEGERLRGELADVIGDLLRWARSQERCGDGNDPDEGKAA
ncbi:hypothetical protein AB0H34_00910 [Saccharopolyspora shandongensis]|uniref:hypothetical protein n=1 Tax=Saccharopolyspora shandongensis TaxID=418495 RepID=UPI0033C33F47